MERNLYRINSYGHIQLHLKEVMEQKNLTRNALARAIDVRFEVIDKWYLSDVQRLDLDVLARICYVLDCTPSDIISYETDTK